MPIPVTERPLRRDAALNRERIVAAARAVFAEQGLEAPMEEVAHRAGVGVGTVYRRFPAKAELVDAVFEDALGETEAIARSALELPDPWLGFVAYLEGVLALNAANRGLKDVLGSHELGRSRIAAVGARLRPLVGRLISRAQEQGSLRADFSPTDLPLLFMTTGRVMEATADCAPDIWRRFFALMLDGLRAENATPLPVQPLTFPQLGQLRGRHR
jgi:AcrR family transcriptional regulator